MACSDLEPPGGLKFYQLGLERNDGLLEEYLKTTGVAAVNVIDAASEQRVANVCKKIEASPSRMNGGEPLVVELVISSSDRYLRLTDLLSMGLYPGSTNIANQAAPLVAIIHGNYNCASALIACRPWQNHDDDELDRCLNRVSLTLH